MTRYRSREIVRTLAAALEDLPVVVLTGMRQTGKTTLLLHDPTLAGRRYVSLDDFATLEAATHDPDAFVDTNEPLTIDEAQRCPQLLIAIKRRVDRSRAPGRYLLSGSANFSLLAGLSESLAGRAVYLTLHALTRREIRGTISGPLAIRRFFDSGRWPEPDPGGLVSEEDILRGGMPQVAWRQVRDRALWFTGFEQTYLERDVRQLAHVTDLLGFRRLLRLTALRTGQVLNLGNLARDAHLATGTAERYLALLEASFVVFQLPPYLANRSSRLIKSPKVFVTDAGLACFLTGAKDLASSWVDPLKGSLLETYVLQNLCAMIGSRWPGASLFFWRIQGRHEVDVVIEAGRETLAVEVKAARRWDERDLSGLRAFLAANRRCRAGLLAHDGTATVKLGDRLWAVPLSRLLA